MIAIWIGITAALLAQTVDTAKDRLAHLRAQAAAEAKAGDPAARLKTILEIEQLLNGSPASVASAAAAYAVVGDTEHSLVSLESLAAIGQAYDALLKGKDDRFKKLSELPRYKAVLDRMKANESPVAQSETAFVVDDSELQPEDIDFDPASGTFLVTSVRKKKIVRITSDGKTKDFAQSPTAWPMMAIKVDTHRSLVWATEVAPQEFTAVPKSDWGHSAVLCFDLKTGALRQRIDGGTTALADLALTPAGEPILSDGDGSGVFRIRGNKLETINGTDFISPQTPSVLPDGKHAFVPDYLRGIGVLDLDNGQVQWLNANGKQKAALSGVDGVYFADGALLLTQNGTSPERVVRMEIDTTMSKVISEQVIERSTPTLGDPTHGVAVGAWFYYIANSGWDKIGDNGELKAGEAMSPARVMRYRLR
jgi:hypothetical protein